MAGAFLRRRSRSRDNESKSCHSLPKAGFSGLEVLGIVGTVIGVEVVVAEEAVWFATNGRFEGREVVLWGCGEKSRLTKGWLAALFVDANDWLAGAAASNWAEVNSPKSASAKEEVVGCWVSKGVGLEKFANPILEELVAGAVG